MPLPLLFIGIAAATGGLGVGKTIKAGIDANNAKKINKNANEIVEASTEWLNTQRMACRNSLRQLGEQKLFILNSSITEFFDTFTKIKNEDGIIDSFSVTSDFDRNKVLYRIPLDAWMEYMDYIASDDIVGMSSHYDPKADDYVFSRKERGKR